LENVLAQIACPAILRRLEQPAITSFGSAERVLDPRLVAGQVPAFVILKIQLHTRNFAMSFGSKSQSLWEARLRS